jgi:2-polyprenyl-6-methoxyphenol hydroxylase-like FAD-dependent oxidoreductase
MADQLIATVAGGGIAGLGSGLALAQAGWQVTVLERAPAYGEVGAGLGFTPNGMAAAQALGVDDAVRAAGYLAAHAGYQDPTGKWILRIPQDRAKLRERAAVWGIHRQSLHTALLDAARSAGVELIADATVRDVRPGTPGGERVTVTWTGVVAGHRRQCDLLVGADGVRSAVRKAIFPQCLPRYAGSTSWRAVIPDTSYAGGLTEVWGPRTEFGAMRVSASELYWFGEFVRPEGDTFEDELAAAREHFAGWAPWVRDIIAATDPGRLMRHDVYYLADGCPSYTAGRVVLVGDAAHAMLPTVGQGAASALEDAICVGRMIGIPARAGGDLAAALAAFDRARRPRCRWLASHATRIARFGFELGPGRRQKLRNAVLGHMPVGLALSAGSRITAWSPPPATEPGQ